MLANLPSNLLRFSLMGNTLVTTACFQAPPQDTEETKLVFYGGATRLLPRRRHLAGELMFQSPDSIVCHAGSFFIGQPLPVLSIDDELLGGETYFVIPADRLPCSVLTAASLAALSWNRGEQTRAAAQQLASGCSPFEYVKGEDGRAHIKVMPEFITRMISFNGGEGEEGEMEEGGGGTAAVREEICSTPELRRHYERLVGSRESRVWSPRLETITESKKGRLSPARFCIGVGS